ncbi:hypothetical protein [Mesorhizobium sp.]|uniref:hypothetical protein n=1 Tax=Mesorhizobium sp. TaxID=1871066 RepID=UPI003BA8514E
MAAQMGWNLARNNVIVEGTSDVAYFTRASDLHAIEHGRPLLDADLAVVAAGRSDDGGVDGVNRRLSFFRQLAENDAEAAGVVLHRFVGLFDNDMAGRGAFVVASRFDRRVEPYVDVFLLHPVMPMFPPALDRAMEVARVNRPFGRIDWEIEDLCSERVLSILKAQHPSGVLAEVERGGRTHREIHPQAKPRLKQIFVEQAKLGDAAGFVELLRMLRIYLNLDHDFIKS